MWLREGKGVTFDRHLPFLHRFQESRLRPSGSAIQLVSQQQLSKDRALTKHELAGPAVQDLSSGDVRWKQIGGELDAFKVHAKD